MKLAVLMGVCVAVSSAEPLRAGSVLATFPGSEPEAAGVSVSVALAHEGMALAVTFTPDPAAEPMHLYDMALPKTGLAGVGRPTLVETVAGQAVIAAGSARCLQEPLAAPDALKPYPPGPVTMVLPLRMSAQPEADPFQLKLQLTYMACGETMCNRPVTDRVVTVPLPVRWVAGE
ncbi:MAG: hypothetical protein PF961_17240 [Planctomycetota bacterium]|nr:hypothetical protein [Planctomycetota bacterium]